MRFCHSEATQWFIKTISVFLSFQCPTHTKVETNKKLLYTWFVITNTWKTVWETFLIPFSITLMKTNFSQLTNLVFVVITRLQINYEQLFMKQTLETHGVYLEMPTAFRNVWCAWLIYKLKSVEVLGKTLKFIKTFLNSRSQSVFLNRWASDWSLSQTVVP